MRVHDKMCSLARRTHAIVTYFLIKFITSAVHQLEHKLIPTPTAEAHPTPTPPPQHTQDNTTLCRDRAKQGGGNRSRGGESDTRAKFGKSKLDPQDILCNSAEGGGRHPDRAEDTRHFDVRPKPPARRMGVRLRLESR